MGLSLGLDFGTTNTVIALPSNSGGAAPLVFYHGNEAISTFRSVLCFWKEEIGPQSLIEAEAGPWGIDYFIDNPGNCRFLQSLKSFLASHLFQDTQIYGKRVTFEDLLVTFLELVRAHGGKQMETLPHRFVVGRPVRFAGRNPDPQLAINRYRAALERLGVEDVRFVYEPVAAAFFFAQRLTADSTVLVADFGGGTSDFSIMRFEVNRDVIRTRALAWSGVGVGGDNFDFHIIDKLISPKLGKDSVYISMGKELTLPKYCFMSFARWSELSVMKTTREFRELKKLLVWSLEPDRLKAFIDLIELDLGYALYKAVSDAKERLSKADQTEFEFVADSIELRDSIRRSEFETWIIEELRKMSSAVNDVLRQAGLEPADIDKVFLTGGTSFVPAVRRIFEDRFGPSRIETGDELVSIAQGLALIGEREDIDQWCTTDTVSEE